MKNSKIALPLIALCSAVVLSQGVFASPSQVDQDFTNQMTQLEEVSQQQVYIASDSAFNHSDVMLEVQTDMQDIYITKAQAQEMQLETLRTFNVYSSRNQGQLSDTIAKMIHQDKPAYFSVDVYSSNIGKSDTVEYFAKVTEYK